MKIFHQSVQLGGILNILVYFVDSSNSCQNVDPAQLDNKWIDSRLENGRVDRWYVAMSSKLEAWSPTDGIENTRPAVTPKTPARRCWDASIFTPKGRVHVPFICAFSKHEFQNCVLRTEETRLRRNLRLAGDFTISKSDNSTYMVWLGCLEDDKKFWFVLSRKRILPQNVTDEILDHVERVGFDRNDISDKYDDRFAFHKLRHTTCRRQDYPDYDGTDEEEKRLAQMENANASSTANEVGSTTEKNDKVEDKDKDKNDSFISSLIKTVKKLIGSKTKD